MFTPYEEILLDGLLFKLDHYDLAAEVNTPEQKTLYIQLEKRTNGYYCLWTYNKYAAGNMEHDDCRLSRKETLNDLYREMMTQNINLAEIESWTTF